RGDVEELQPVLQQFDEIFAVLQDDDAEKTRQVLEWARAEGKLADDTAALSKLSKEEVEQKIEQRQQARRARDFARADTIRRDLEQAGIILEDTKDGVRWKHR